MEVFKSLLQPRQIFFRIDGQQINRFVIAMRFESPRTENRKEIPIAASTMSSRGGGREDRGRGGRREEEGEGQWRGAREVGKGEWQPRGKGIRRRGGREMRGKEVSEEMETGGGEIGTWQGSIKLSHQ